MSQVFRDLLAEGYAVCVHCLNEINPYTSYNRPANLIFEPGTHYIIPELYVLPATGQIFSLKLIGEGQELVFTGKYIVGAPPLTKPAPAPAPVAPAELVATPLQSAADLNNAISIMFKKLAEINP